MPFLFIQFGSKYDAKWWFKGFKRSAFQPKTRSYQQSKGAVTGQNVNGY